MIRKAFERLLEDWARGQELILVAELEYATSSGAKVYPDGTILYELRVPFGYWEAKDTDDDLDQEIEKKQRAGYPSDNILYENSETAVLIQNGNEVARCAMADTAAADAVLRL